MCRPEARGPAPVSTSSTFIHSVSEDTVQEMDVPIYPAGRRKSYGPALLLLLVMVSWCGPAADAVILTPPYFNLAEGRRVTATATCGVDTEGPELYCKLVGANAENDANVNLIQGQVCDYCDASKPEKLHLPEYAVDGMETWWQSPPLSRGMKYNEVNFTIDLGQEFHVAYVYVRMGNSPRPGLWVLEKSSDYGKTFTPWQYFSDSPSDCELHFGRESLQPITRDDSVICSTEYSKIVPLEGGEIPISLLNNRPSANAYFNSSVLQEWTRATNVRLRLLRTKNLLGHLMSVARQDLTVTRRYFYSIKDISIGGRCMCNGHADTCDRRTDDDTTLVCHCQHNTCGDQCAECCPGYRQKRWRISNPYMIFKCEPCNCHNHTSDCEYDEDVDEKHLSLDVHGKYEGGGVCVNCRHNTEGINCNRCRPGYYRPHDRRWDQENVCEPCRCDPHFSTGNCAEGTGRCECRLEFREPDCDACSYGHFGYPDCRPCECFINGTVGYHCEATRGMCPCKPNFGGAHCKECADGFHGMPECQPCQCNAPLGALSTVCDKESGSCSCRSNFRGRACDECEHGYFNYPNCTYCKCDISGTREGLCDKKSGECLCREGYGGERCDQCVPGYYGYPDCRPCECDAAGSAGTVCDTAGRCPCLSNFAGRTCSSCSPGYYRFPECLACECDSHGAVGVSCDGEGACQCRVGFEGSRCDKCRAGFYNFPRCEECNCNPGGVAAEFAGCDTAPAGELCRCKERVRGRQCDRCRPLFWNLRAVNPDGCESCNCDLAGTLTGVASCRPEDGQCTCKPTTTGRACDSCSPGTYRLHHHNLFGCTHCACNIGGSVDYECNQRTGQCTCLPRVRGRACDMPIQTHYFPTLFHMQYELEDGRTPDQAPLRYGDVADLFPGHSGRGYATFSNLQPEVLVDVDIHKPSLFRMVLSYVNPGSRSVDARVTIVPDNPAENEQQFHAHFRATRDPALVTVSLARATNQAGLAIGASTEPGAPAALVMNPGRWTVHIKTDKPLFVDYLVLLPSAYYEATLLSQQVTESCVLGQRDPCRHYAFPDVNTFDVVHGEGAFLSDGESRRSLTEFYNFTDGRLAELFPNMTSPPQLPLLDDMQPEVHLDMTVTRPGPHVLLLLYVTDDGRVIQIEQDNNTMDHHHNRSHHVTVHTSDQRTREQGRAALHACPYSTPCRQPVLDMHHRVKVFHFGSNFVRLTLKAQNDEMNKAPSVALRSVVAIPLDHWTLDYVRPAAVCVRHGGVCVSAKFSDAPESRRVKFEKIHSITPGVTDDDYAEVDYDEEDNTTTMQPPMTTMTPQTNVSKTEEAKDGMLLGSGPGAEPVVDVRAKVPEPGHYVFIVQYRQPSQPTLNVHAIIQNGQFYDAQMRVPHCPAIAGCRAVVTQPDGNVRFALTENFVLTLRLSKHNEIFGPAASNEEDEYLLEDLEQQGSYRHAADATVHLQQLLVVPANRYDDSLLREESFDRSGEFIARCGHDHFRVDPAISDPFCRSAIFALTMDYNSGALSCQCNFEGSLSFECNPFGGQCQCRPNVIGRRCDECRTGYFGFPDCKRCNCPPSAVCDIHSGRCMCPPRVTGELCDRCMPYTYGYDPVTGCAECECNTRGVLHNQNCNLLDGMCECRPNVEGRRCDHCTAGHYGFPYCQQCACDTRGTLDQVCDAETARCLCKPNVEGHRCDMCREGTFDLQANNKDGCTRCFCFGRTTRCSSAFGLHRTAIIDMRDWMLLTIDGAAPGSGVHNVTARYLDYEIAPPLEQVNDSIVSADLSNARSIVAYFSAPEAYLGNRLTAYGGELDYTLYYTISDGGTAVPGADIVLEGGGLQLLHHALEQPAADLDYHSTLSIVESNFMLPSGLPATRDNLMRVLRDLRAIHVRATYWESATSARLERASLSIATENGLGAPATEVERCQCPPGYRGLSCEDCAPGHWRSPGGHCIPCQCHGHADTCDEQTGVCLDCEHNTRGDQCDQCAEGYHGDALLGTPGDCLICACPLPTASNNFATSCEVTEDGESIHCECRTGYFGARCQSCAVGFHGRPEVPGGSCTPCNCSGNINPAERESCDSVTGDCLRCLYHTYGPACALCRPGYYGDAVRAKDCQPCACAEQGTQRCDTNTGRCECLPGVEGDKCDRCRPHHWGFSTGRGCQPCSCDSAAHGEQCDDTTGQCRCRLGVTGRTCDRCAVGFYNYTMEGCITCGCHTNYALGFGCNAQTGQCECLPGVIGDKCDRCPHRWVLIPQQGCFECDTCVHALLDAADDLSNTLMPVAAEFEATSSGHFTAQRLKYLRGRHEELQPRVQLLDPSRENVLHPAERALATLEQEERILARRSNYTLEASATMPDMADALRLRALLALDKAHAALTRVTTTTADIGALSFGPSNDDSPRIEQAELVIKELKDLDFGLHSHEVTTELERARHLLEEVQALNKPVVDDTNELEGLRDDMRRLNERVNDLSNQTERTAARIAEIEEIKSRLSVPRTASKVAGATITWTDAHNQLRDAQKLLMNATRHLKDAHQNTQPDDVFDDGNQLDDLMEEFRKAVLMDPSVAHGLQDSIIAVQEHANELNQTAQDLDHQFSGTRNVSLTAVDAANAYKNIVQAVQDGRILAEAALKNANESEVLTAGLAEMCTQSAKYAENLLENANLVLYKARGELEPQVSEARRRVADLHASTNRSRDHLQEVQAALERMEVRDLEDAAEHAVDVSMAADKRALAALELVGTVDGTVKENLERARQLPHEVKDAQRDLRQAHEHLANVETVVPDVMRLVDELGPQQAELRITAARTEEAAKTLRHRIEAARELANRVRVSVKFSPTTTLELRPPENLASQSTALNVSVYASTNQTNGLLWYLGNEQGTHLPHTRSDDYMALKLQNGYPVLSLDVGNGPDTLANSKYVADGKWYQLAVERVGQRLRLVVREELDDGRVQEHATDTELSGPFTMFNLDPERSRLFAGGYPTSFTPSDELPSSFDGRMEEMLVGGEHVSFLNFIDAEDNEGAIAPQRGTLLNLAPSTGCYLNGRGYSILSAKPHALRTRPVLRLRFRTSTPDGLLFFAERALSHMALELRDGKVQFTYNLGSGTATIETEPGRRYNDGRWHDVEASRNGAAGQLRVDGSSAGSTTAPGASHAFDAPEWMYFGGRPDDRETVSGITQHRFDGCIEQVQINGAPVDLAQSKRALGLSPGCPVPFGRLASLDGAHGAHLHYSNVSAAGHLHLSVHFRATPGASDGLLMYVAGRDPSDGDAGAVSLALVNGSVVLTSRLQRLQTREPANYSDGEWHVATVTHDETELRLDVDDWDTVTVPESAPQPPRFMYGDLYVAGLPSGFRPAPGTVPTPRPFAGCIADAIINNHLVDFSNAAVVLGRCLLDPRIVPQPDEDLYDEGSVVIPHQTWTDSPIPETPPPHLTDLPTRGDGGIDEGYDFEEEKVTTTTVKTTAFTTPIITEIPDHEVERTTVTITTTPKKAVSMTTSTESTTTVTKTTGMPFIPTPAAKNTTESTEPVGCKLSVEPGEGAFKLNGEPNSRLEYRVARGTFRRKYDFALDLKTTAKDGLIFYVSDAAHAHYVAVTMRAGRLQYVFDCGAGRATMETEDALDDGLWHNIVFSRVNTDGRLEVDGRVRAEARAPGSVNGLNFTMPFYVGGVPEKTRAIVSEKLGSAAAAPFRGCVRRPLMHNKPLEQERNFGLPSCYDHVEQGYFFGKRGGHVRLFDRYRVGTEIDIQMDVKPRNVSGLLLAVMGKKDYLVLQMVDGDVRFVVDNGGGPIQAAFRPRGRHDFCDGKWHTIQAIKSKNVVSLSVDNTFADAGFGQQHVTATSGPLFLGGHRFLDRLSERGDITRAPYIGCIRNVQINKKIVKVMQRNAFNHVEVGGCPTT